MKSKFKAPRVLLTSAWFATIALACSGYAQALEVGTVATPENLTVNGNTTGTGWGLFKQGVDFGNNGEAMLNWFPGPLPAGTVTFDINWADGTFTWRDTVNMTPSNKMILDAANNLFLYRSTGTAGITLAPETGKITLPAGTGSTTGSGIYFGANTTATLATTAAGAAIFPSQVTLQNGLFVSNGNMNIASSTPSSHSSTGALTVAGGLGVGGAIHANVDSFINGVRIGRGFGNQTTNTALGSNVLSSNSTGDHNTGTGVSSLRNNTWGTRNTALGSNSLLSNTWGGYNSAVGVSSLSGNISGSYNSALGFQSLVANTTGNYNSATGSYALTSNTTGSNNVGFGNEAGFGNATGILNVFLGASAGKFQANGTTSLSTTNRSIYIGANSRGLNNLDYNSIVIGNEAIGQGANTTVIGNGNTQKTVIYGNSVQLAGGTVTSSNAVAINGGTASLYGATAISGGTASGMNSFAVGYNAIASSTGSVAFGRYNKTWTSGSYTWAETDPLLLIGNGTSSTALSNAITTLKNGQTTLTNKAWKENPTAPLADPTSPTDNGGEALVVDGHTVLNGKVIISVPQGDISMGIYQ